MKSLASEMCQSSLIYYWLTFFFYRFNPDTGLLGMSYSVFKMSDLHPLGKLILSVFSLLRLVTVEEGVGEDKKSTRVNNLTLINFVIKVLGPLHERTLTIIIMGIQVKLLIKNLYQYLWRTTLQSHNLLKPWSMNQGHWSPYIRTESRIFACSTQVYSVSKHFHYKPNSLSLSLFFGLVPFL